MLLQISYKSLEGSILLEKQAAYLRNPVWNLRERKSHKHHRILLEGTAQYCTVCPYMNHVTQVSTGVPKANQSKYVVYTDLTCLVVPYCPLALVLFPYVFTVFRRPATLLMIHLKLLSLHLSSTETSFTKMLQPCTTLHAHAFAWHWY